MSYSALQIAKWFVDRANAEGKSLSIMSLLKLTYIAHGWHLEMRKQPLFDDRIEAWQYGPVIPEVYRMYRGQGVNVSTAVPSGGPDISPEDNDLLGQIWKLYGGMSPFRLSEITHEIGGPWHTSTETGGYYAPISNDQIRVHYEMKRLKSNQAQNLDSVSNG